MTKEELINEIIEIVQRLDVYFYECNRALGAGEIEKLPIYYEGYKGKMYAYLFVLSKLGRKDIFEQYAKKYGFKLIDEKAGIVKEDIYPGFDAGLKKRKIKRFINGVIRYFSSLVKS